MAAISIVSYYTVSQLTNMTGPNNNDVINNQNHVVEALQGEHNKLERTEADVNRLSKHIDDLEKHLLIMNDLDTAFINILSINKSRRPATKAFVISVYTMKLCLYDPFYLFPAK